MTRTARAPRSRTTSKPRLTSTTKLRVSESKPAPRLIADAEARAATLRAATLRMGLAPEGLAAAASALVGAPDARLAPAEQRALWLWRSRASEPLPAFLRAFLFGERVSAAEARLIFGADLPRAQKLGLLTRSARGFAGGLGLSLPGSTAIFSDAQSPKPRRDHVEGPTRATLALLGVLPPGERGTALDLGTGAGVLAMALATTARQVTATDISARALGLAALNHAFARSDDADPSGDASSLGIEWLLSDRFAALGGRRFDLIVGNLPFVVNPQPRFGFRDSPLPEDRFVESVVSEAGAHLTEGGFALLLAQWVHRDGEAEDERLAPWFVAAGADAVVYRLDAEATDLYAARWSAGLAGVELEGEEGARARLRLLGRWVLSMKRSRIMGVSTGLIVLRRRTGARHFMSIDDVAPDAGPPTWTEIAARFAALERSADDNAADDKAT